ncbi:hypothetical protein [Costertonia aggregata]|uniref:Uncharacterized protein n=1 Tax=Costertonia aggregata TaxID=343403 RepID=A0A7H9ARA4_9FLAO|nr:hypothetical protein [Costertonia aggregata]QLG46008.1 hypothetical protein HYG79_11845 [Costertonia aggregata]
MKAKSILFIVGVVVLLFFLFRACAWFVRQKVEDSISEITTAKKEFDYRDINFSMGEYAIILDDKNPPILIDDPDVLEANKDKIKMRISWMSYLPGEGAGPSGLRLFKNNTLIKAKLARKFKVFEMGNIREYGRPVELKSIYEPRIVYERQKDSLAKNNKVFISRETKVNAEGHEYRFTLKCPPILVSERDSTFNDHEYGKAFAERIKTGLADFSGFKTNSNTSHSAEPNPILSINKGGASRYLRNTETNSILSLRGYTFYGAQLTFFCTKEFYEQVQKHDFSPAFIRAGVSKENIKSLIREKIGSDNNEVTLDAVFESMFPANFKVGHRYEQKYELRYFELVEDL